MLVLSRDESDPNGLVVAKRVEEVFVREALIWELTVGGRVLRTTAEHPFNRLGDDWSPTHELRVGDLLRCEDGSYATVDAVRETGEWETVYNVRIADFHTYFVGCEEWGLAVWAHNANYGFRGDDALRKATSAASWKYPCMGPSFWPVFGFCTI